jgi:diguanylate cyclase
LESLTLPPNTTIFLLGLAVGTGLLVFGMLFGYWFGKKAAPPQVDQAQFLSFVRNLSLWTSEFAGDVSKYQTQLDLISKQARGKNEAPREEVLGMLSQIMSANQQLQQRLDDTEKRLESQTIQISSYLTEARTDGLTGLLNRRAFDKATDDLFSAWTGKQQSFSLGLIDIDHFKQINDTHGHPAGDTVLKQVAQLIQSELRDTACVARYGGEEFGVLMLASVEGTSLELDRLREKMSKMEVQHDGNTQIMPEEKIGKLVRRADEALYAAKLGGRNRVYLHDGANCMLVTKGNGAGSLSEANGVDTKKTSEVESRVQNRLQQIVDEESRRKTNFLRMSREPVCELELWRQRHDRIEVKLRGSEVHW